jgi:Protein kinase domain
MSVNNSGNFPAMHSFKTQLTTASASWSQSGRLIKEGREAHRIKLGNAEDPRFFIRVKVKNISKALARMKASSSTERSNKKKVRYLTVSDLKEPLLLKIKSATYRLHLTKKEIKEIQKPPAQAWDLLNKKADKLQAIISNYEQLSKNLAFISPKTLMKVVQTALTCEVTLTQLGSTKRLNNSQVKEFYKDLIHSYPVMMRLNKNNQLKLFFIGKELGEGSSASVKEVVSAKNGQIFALKQIDNHSTALPEIANEMKLLTLVHEQGNAWGIQEKPHQITKVFSLDKAKQEGHLGAKYETDLFSYIESIYKEEPLTVDLEARLPEMHQLLAGLNKLHSLSILHSDINPQNILIKKNSKNQLDVHLADLGGARQITKEMNLQDIFNLRATRSPEYFTREDHLALLNYYQSGRREKFIIQEQKQDIFALGLTLYALFTNSRAYELDRNDRVIFAAADPFEELMDLPIELSRMIMKMIDKKSSERPSAESAFNMFNSYLQRKQPVIYQAIQERLQEGNYHSLTK